MDGPLEDSPAYQLTGNDHDDRTTLSRIAYVDRRRIDIPEGYKIAKEYVKPGDKYLNCCALRKGKIEWLEVTTFSETVRCPECEQHTKRRRVAAFSFSLCIRPI